MRDESTGRLIPAWCRQMMLKRQILRDSDTHGKKECRSGNPECQLNKVEYSLKFKIPGHNKKPDFFSVADCADSGLGPELRAVDFEP